MAKDIENSNEIMTPKIVRSVDSKEVPIPSFLSKDNSEEDMLKKGISERIIKNFDYERKRQKRNISELEKKIGVKTGYVRDIENNNYSKVPSLMFVYHASEELNVGMDELVKQNLRSESSDEVLTRRFIKRIIKQTNSDVLHWKTQTEKQMNARINRNELPNPLFKIEKTPYGNLDFLYDSLFGKNDGLVVREEIYYARIDTNCMICIVPVENDSLPGFFDDYEIYLLTGIKNDYNPFEGDINIDYYKKIVVEPIVCTYISDVFDNLIYRLNNVVKESLNRSFLSDNSRDIMKRFV